MKPKINEAIAVLASAADSILVICYIAFSLITRGHIEAFKVPATIIVAINILLASLYLFLLIKKRAEKQNSGWELFFASVTLAGSVLLLYLYIGLF